MTAVTPINQTAGSEDKLVQLVPKVGKVIEENRQLFFSIRSDGAPELVGLGVKESAE